jgi:hypothetical protein
MDVIKKAELVAELALIERILKVENPTFEEQLELKDKAHNIKMELNGVKPQDSYIECIGCGS